MTWSIHLLILLALFNSSYSKEETKKALIIAVDELKPEESDAIISDLTIKDQLSSSTYQISKRAPINKQLDYIIVSPDDLKDLKELELGGITIDKPKILRYPDSGSDESDEAASRNRPYTHPTDSYSGKGRKTASKYPSRPAPPLATYSGGDSSNERGINQDPSYLQKDYSTYDSPNTASYKAPVLDDTTKVLTISGDQGTAYHNDKPTSYSNPSSYSVPSSTYGSSQPSAYSGTSSYSAPSSAYGNSKPSSYVGYSNYRQPKYDPYAYYGGAKPSSYYIPHTYVGPSSYGPPKPVSYTAPSTYGNSKPIYYIPSYETSKPTSYSEPTNYEKPNSYSGPSSYSNVKPGSYSGSPPYESSKSDSYTGSPNYERSKPTSYSGPAKYENPKPSTYTKTSNYESPNPSTYYEPSNYGSPKPEIYSVPYNYQNPEYSYSKSKPDTPSTPSSYSSPGKSYSGSKSPKYSGPSSYSKPSSPDYDSSAEKSYPASEKYISQPETHHYPEKTYIYDQYNPSKSVPHTSGYESDSHYSPKKTYKKEYYDSPPPIKHVSYDDLPSPHKTAYEHPDSEYHDDSPNHSFKNSYRDAPKSVPHDTYYHNSPPKKLYHSNPTDENDHKDSYHHSSLSSKPTYGKKLYDENYKHTSTYNSNPYTDSHRSPEKSYSKKHSYDTPKTSYGTSYEPSSYEEPINSHLRYRYPSSKVTYESPSSYNEPYTHSTRKIKEDYSDDTKYKSSHNENPSSYDSPSSLEYGSRYPTAYRKTRHTDSKTPATSYFTIDDARSPDDVPENDKKPKSTTTESHSYYHYDESSEAPDHHSAKKNYSPVRPAPLKDELEQPRYPPLPRRYKKDKSKRYYDNGEVVSKDSSENYKPESSVTAPKSFNPGEHKSDYTQSSYSPSYSSKTAAVHPVSAENHNYHYTDHSSEETEEPLVYTKTSTITYTKPHRDSSTEHSYMDKSAKSSYTLPTINYSRKKENISKGKEFVGSQPEYSRTKYKSSQRSPAHFVHSYAYKSESRPTENTSLPNPSSSLADILPPKRARGVVYRSRQSYPKMKPMRKHKGYLPYKPYYSKSISAYDHKPYESVPTEISEQNVTRHLPVYDLPKRITSKSNSFPPKKYISYSSLDSKDHSNHDAIPGKPGKDYPVLKEIPYNHFSCEDKLPGFYADVENRCQVYYQCSEEGRLQSFLCPNGTIFNQQSFVCEWWHNVDCSKSEKYFGKNNQLYKPSTGIPSSTKNIRTLNDDYESPVSENHRSHDVPLYNVKENEEFRSEENARRRRRYFK